MLESPSHMLYGLTIIRAPWRIVVGYIRGNIFDLKYVDNVNFRSERSDTLGTTLVAPCPLKVMLRAMPSAMAATGHMCS